MTNEFKFSQASDLGFDAAVIASWDVAPRVVFLAAADADSKAASFHLYGVRALVVAREAIDLALLADANIRSQKATMLERHVAPPKFAKTYCSQCGGEFGPGDHGYSHCTDHKGLR